MGRVALWLFALFIIWYLAGMPTDPEVIATPLGVIAIVLLLLFIM